MNSFKRAGKPLMSQDEIRRMIRNKFRESAQGPVFFLNMTELMWGLGEIKGMGRSHPNSTVFSQMKDQRETNKTHKQQYISSNLTEASLKKKQVLDDLMKELQPKGKKQLQFFHSFINENSPYLVRPKPVHSARVTMTGWGELESLKIMKENQTLEANIQFKMKQIQQEIDLLHSQLQNTTTSQLAENLAMDHKELVQFKINVLRYTLNELKNQTNNADNFTEGTQNEAIDTKLLAETIKQAINDARRNVHYNKIHEFEKKTNKKAPIVAHYVRSPIEYKEYDQFKDETDDQLLSVMESTGVGTESLNKRTDPRFDPDFTQVKPSSFEKSSYKEFLDSIKDYNVNGKSFREILESDAMRALGLTGFVFNQVDYFFLHRSMHGMPVSEEHREYLKELFKEIDREIGPAVRQDVGWIFEGMELGTDSQNQSSRKSKPKGLSEETKNLYQKYNNEMKEQLKSMNKQ